MSKVIYVEKNGARHEIDLPEGVSVMQGALNNSIPGIDGDCGGKSACGTCHVHVDASWLGKLGPISDLEASLLSFTAAAQTNSRLSCQIKMSSDLDGLIVNLPDAQH